MTPRDTHPTVTPRVGSSFRPSPSSILVTTVLLAAGALLGGASVAAAQRVSNRGQRGMARPDIGPGQGPQESFQSADWEYWWYLHHELLVPLRPGLARKGVRPVQGNQLSDLIETLRRTARDSNPDVRAESLMALAKAGSVVDAPVLVEALGDKTLSVRLRAILALGVLGAAGEAPKLAGLFDSRRAGLVERRHAAVGLALMGGPAARTFFEFNLDPKRFISLDAPLQEGVALAVGLTADATLSDEIDKLLDLSSSRMNVAARAYLVGALGRLGDQGSMARLLDEVTGGSNSLSRRSAALGLGELLAGTGDLQAINVLGNATRNEGDVVTRNFIHAALGRIGGADAASILQRSLLVESDHVADVFKTRPLAAIVLGLIRDPRMTEPLVRQFAVEEDHSDRAAFAVALGLQGDGRAAPRLRRELARTKDPILKGYLALGLGLLKDVDSTKPLLAILAGENDIELLPRTALALALAGKQAEATGVLVARLKRDRGSHVRRSILYCLGLMGDARALAPVLAVLRSSAPAAVRRYAAVALGDLADARDIRPLARIGAGLNYTIEPQLLQGLLIAL